MVTFDKKMQENLEKEPGSLEIPKTSICRFTDGRLQNFALTEDEMLMVYYRVQEAFRRRDVLNYLSDAGYLEDDRLNEAQKEKTISMILDVYDKAQSNRDDWLYDIEFAADQILHRKESE